MKTLYLLRHAKAASGDGMDDHLRPLVDRGIEDARRMGEYLRAITPQPQRIVCSTATRTRMTLESLFPANRPETEFESKLYLASLGDVLWTIQQTARSVDAILVIGHNPSMHQCAVMLAGKGSDAGAVVRLQEKYPTCTLTSFQAAVQSWDEFPTQSKLVSLMMPKLLA